MNRKELHKLIDAAPESELPTIGSFINFVIHQSQKDPLERRLDEAPYDDEHLSEEDLTAIQEGLEDIKAGRVFTLEEVEKVLFG